MFKEYRQKMGYTQEELSEILNISTRHLQRLENNERIPTLEMLKKIILTLKINDKDIANYIKNIQTKKMSKTTNNLTQNK